MNQESELTRVLHKILEEAEKAGLESTGQSRAGTFFHLNQETVTAKVNEAFEGKLELMDVKAALKKYTWLEDYMWKVVSKDKDEFTKKGVEITHEAAVGKISEKEIAYLMTRRLSRDQAVSLIIRGFMDVSILGLPEALNAEIKRIFDASTGAA